MPEQISSLFVDFRLNSWPSDEELNTKVINEEWNGFVTKVNLLKNFIHGPGILYQFILRVLLKNAVSLAWSTHEN